MLPVVEHFYTIQGEGHHSGNASYFIRLGGCDVGCTWCDTKYSWPAEGHQEFSESQLLDLVKSRDAKRVVVTGGEPSMHELTSLLDRFSKDQIYTQVETSGAHILRGSPDWITFSPKKFLKPQADIYPRADEIKIVVFNQSDLKWAEKEAEKCRPEIPKYLQPEWNSPQMIPLITDYCKRNPQWLLSLQVHKIIDIP